MQVLLLVHCNIYPIPSKSELVPILLIIFFSERVAIWIVGSKSIPFNLYFGLWGNMASGTDSL